jgi:hypothetical protein
MAINAGSTEALGTVSDCANPVSEMVNNPTKNNSVQILIIGFLVKVGKITAFWLIVC